MLRIRVGYKTKRLPFFVAGSVVPSLPSALAGLRLRVRVKVKG